MKLRLRDEFEREDILRVVDNILGDDVHAKRVLSIANAATGVLASGSLAVAAIGQGMAHVCGLVTKHSVKQVDRLLGNPRFAVWDYFAQWVPFVVGARQRIMVALDWTEFDRDGHSTVAANLMTSHGRAIPLLWRTVRKDELDGRRNLYEDEVLERLRETLPVGVAVTVVADRGFMDTKLMAHLREELGFDFIIRLRSNVWVEDRKGERRPASDWVGTGGRARTLRGAKLTEAGHAVATVVCVQDKDMQEPWCLAASDPHATSAQLKRLYGKRWGIECYFRDTKDLRFGLGMDSIHTKSIQRRDRLFLLGALAIVLLTLLGAACERVGYDRLLKANTVKHRTHSLFRQGQIRQDH